MTTYEIDILYHQITLWHKKIVKTLQLKNNCDLVEINLNKKHIVLELTKYTLFANFLYNGNKILRKRLDILSKEDLKELTDKELNTILTKLHIKKKLENSHSFYCELCDHWYTNNIDENRSIHITRLHLPFELSD